MTRSHFTAGALGSLLIIPIALVTFVYGAKLFLFTLDLQHLQSASQDRSSRLGGHPGSAVQNFAEWQNTFGFSGSATRALALDAHTPMSVARSLQNDVNALTENPTDGLLWLAYANGIAQGQIDFKNADAAIDVSRLVGRREQIVMVGRIVFTLSNWAKSTDKDRSSALREIHDLRWFLRPIERSAIEQAVNSHDTAEREDLRKRVTAALAN